MKKRIFISLLLIGSILLLASFVIFKYETEVTKNKHPYIYDLPFKEGEAFRVVQGYGGLFSHKDQAALDFEMPEGTPIYAAREGTIRSYKEDSDQGGPFTNKNQANYIIITHPDGSVGCYWHLQKNGVVVKKGVVRKGQLIGYSGYTGMALQPHLHFAVKTRFDYDKDSYVKTKFKTTEGVLFLKAGVTYGKPLP